MLIMPTQPLNEISQRNLERFRATSAALEFEDDRRTWRVAEWSSGDGSAVRVQLRSDTGEFVDFVMDRAGRWRIRPAPVEPVHPQAQQLERA